MEAYVARPGLAIVANCDGPQLDAELFDWHFYSSADDIWAHRDVFLSSDPPASGSGSGASAFATEFAAFDWGIPTAPAGWLRGAAAEAGFMAGLENAAISSSSSSLSAAVAGGSFAPALAHARGTGNCPTSLLVFDAGRSFETPSFFAQELFANSAGSSLAACSTSSSRSSSSGSSEGEAEGDSSLSVGGGGGGVAASASCERERCGRESEEGGGGESGFSSSSSSSSSLIFVKIVNYGASHRRVRVSFVDKGSDSGSSGSSNGTTTEEAVSLSPEASATLLAHPDPAASNSFAFPRNVRPVEVSLTLDDLASANGLVELEMPPYSLGVLKVERKRERKEMRESTLALEQQR